MKPVARDKALRPKTIVGQVVLASAEPNKASLLASIERLCFEFLQEPQKALDLWKAEDVRPTKPLSEWPVSAEDLCDRLRDYILPPERLPLSLSRRPFDGLSVSLLPKLVSNALQYPEKSGRLTEAIRETIGFRRLRPSQYVVAETHIDLTTLDHTLTHSLLELDYEFDNFARIQPEQYKHHFTMEMWIRSHDKGRCRELFKLITMRSQSASDLIQAHSSTNGYVETELYNSEYNAAFAFKKPSLVDLDSFPFKVGTFGRFDLPVSDADANERNLPVQCHRVADIHVKMPSHLNRSEYKDVDSREMALLKQALESSGFYGIVSEGGNYIFTAHFYDIQEANAAYRELVRFAERHGGIIGVSREVCTRMWRKEIRTGNYIYLAEVPPLHSRHPLNKTVAPTLRTSGLSNQEKEALSQQ